MKKISTLTVLLMLTMAVSAQGYRKWDFTNWSAATVASLQAEALAGVTGGAWSDTEKANGDNPQPGNCYWSYAESNSADGTLVANGAPIAETEGLLFNPAYLKNRSLAIAVNYSSTSLGTYTGPQYLWLGGGNKAAGSRVLCFTIPKVKIGQKITFTVESHKPSDPRGISLFVNDVNSDANQIGESFKPTTLETYSWENWTLPEGVTDEDGDGLVDILVYNTNGCHIYAIEIGSTDQKSKVAYVYSGTTDEALTALQANDLLAVDAIDAAATTLTTAQLTAYDATVIAASVPAEGANANALKEALPWTPVVNLNTALYAAWGYGTAVATESPFLKVVTDNDELFKGIEMVEDEGIKGIPMSEAAGISGLLLGDHFAADAVPAVPMENEQAAGIHKHNMSHNAYIFIPFVASPTAEARQLLANAVNAAINSKAEVKPLVAPTFTLDYKNMRTLVSIKSAQPTATIYYTTDGSAPTEQSAVYTEPIEITTEGTVVKAAAIAEGYTLSEVAEVTVGLKQQSAKPAISAEQTTGKSIVTISGEGTLWYNYSGTADTLKATKYTGPVTLTYPRTVYAFATDEGKVNSEAAELSVGISGMQPRIDVLAHMDANSAEYNGGSTSTAYYFSWGKNKSGASGHPYYNTEEGVVEHTTTDPETGDEVTTFEYTLLNTEEEKDFGNGWAIRSRGEIVDWENLTTGTNYGDNNAYNYATVDDENPYFPATKSIINLADKNTEPAGTTFPYNAYVVTTKKFAGPFDVVLNVGSIVKPGSQADHRFVVQTAADGNQWESNWTVLGDTLKLIDSQRLTRNYTRSYEGTDEVYVRVIMTDKNSKIGLYDIYIANQGEKSKELLTGITEATAAAQPRSAAVYNLNGMRLNGKRRGLNIEVRADGTVRKIYQK